MTHCTKNLQTAQGPSLGTYIESLRRFVAGSSGCSGLTRLGGADTRLPARTSAASSCHHHHCWGFIWYRVLLLGCSVHTAAAFTSPWWSMHAFLSLYGAWDAGPGPVWCYMKETVQCSVCCKDKKRHKLCLMRLVSTKKSISRSQVIHFQSFDLCDSFPSAHITSSYLLVLMETNQNWWVGISL